MTISEAVEKTASRIGRRSAKTAVRSVGLTPIEALPYVGIGVVAGVTAMELKDLCETLNDMEDLRKALNPDHQSSPDRTTVCTIKVPTKEELWTSAKSSPTAAWEKSKEFIPSLDDLKAYELPDVNWNDYWEGAGAYWDRFWEDNSTESAPQ